MAHLRFILVLVPLAFAAVPSVLLAGPFKSKPKIDSARVNTLLEALKSHPDEKRRKAAADELGGADVRQLPEVAAALTVALQKDTSALVRFEAAQSLGQLDQVFPQAGVALETAAESDNSPVVRFAAKRALWEYHLNGYRSPKGAGGLSAQTIEPPIASPAGPRPAVALVPAPAPPTAPLLPPPNVPTATPMLPAVSPPAGPRILRPGFLTELMPGLRPAPRLTPTPGPPPILNLTAEPPIAKRTAVRVRPLPAPTSPVPPPTIAVPLPLPPMPREPDYIPTLPPFKPDLPSVVLPPDATPMPPTPMPPRIPATLPTR